MGVVLGDVDVGLCLWGAGGAGGRCGLGAARTGDGARSVGAGGDGGADGLARVLGIPGRRAVHCPRGHRQRIDEALARGKVAADRRVVLNLDAGEVACLVTQNHGSFELLWHATVEAPPPGAKVATAPAR
jgi:hypothetical protein